MSADLYNERFQAPLANASIDRIASDLEMINLAVSNLFMVINEFKEDPFCDEDTVYALTRAGMALMAEAEPMLREIQRRRECDHDEVETNPSTVPISSLTEMSPATAEKLKAQIDAATRPHPSRAGGIGAAGAAGPGSLRAKFDEMSWDYRSGPRRTPRAAGGGEDA